MSFLNQRVSPEPPSANMTVVETELTDSFGAEKEKDHFNNNEGAETAIIDDQVSNECQEGLDGIAEEKMLNANGVFHNEAAASRHGSPCPKLLSWNAEDASPSISRRNHACDRAILLALCLVSLASVVLTLLMLFGVVGPLNCACSGKTGIWVYIFFF